MRCVIQMIQRDWCGKFDAEGTLKFEQAQRAVEGCSYSCILVTGGPERLDPGMRFWQVGWAGKDLQSDFPAGSSPSS